MSPRYKYTVPIVSDARKIGTLSPDSRLETFFEDADYKAYLELMAESCAAARVAVWAYCLMPNHVHLVLVPKDPDGLRAALAEAHRRYTRRVNLREGWRGHLWQERFHSFPMDEDYLMATARYVELNPVRARLVKRPRAWRWSSARAHLSGKDDTLVQAAPLLERIPDWATFLAGGMEEEDVEQKLPSPTSAEGTCATLCLVFLEAKAIEPFPRLLRLHRRTGTTWCRWNTAL